MGSKKLMKTVKIKVEGDKKLKDNEFFLVGNTSIGKGCMQRISSLRKNILIK